MSNNVGGHQMAKRVVLDVIGHHVDRGITECGIRDGRFDRGYTQGPSIRLVDIQIANIVAENFRSHPLISALEYVSRSRFGLNETRAIKFISHVRLRGITTVHITEILSQLPESSGERWAVLINY